MISGVQVPAWDDWLPAKVHPNTATVFTAMLMKEPDNPTLLVDLNDLGDYRFDPAMVHYLADQHHRLTVRGNSPLQVELYKGNALSPEQGISVDANLRVHTDHPLDDRAVYHLRVSLLTNLKLLSEVGRKALMNYPKACILVLSTLDDTLEEKGLLPQVLGGAYIPPRQFETAADEINRGILKRKGVLEPFVPTVGKFFLGAYRNGHH